MQFNITTDYAVRTVLYLATIQKVTSAGEISEAMSIPQDYITVLSKRLRDGGVLQAHRGAGGGYCLARDPREITLKDIIRLMESTDRINRCLEDDSYCSRGAAEVCPVRQVYLRLQRMFTDVLDSVTIDDLVRQPG